MCSMKLFIIVGVILCFLLLEFPPSCAELFDVSIEGEKHSLLDTILVPKGYSEIEPITPQELKSIISKENNKFKILHIYTSWCTFGSLWVDTLLALDTNKFRLYLIAGDINTQKQVNLLRKYLYSKGFYSRSYIINYKMNILDLKNQKNIEKFVKHFLPSYNVKNFPVTLIFAQNNELVGTLTSLDSLLDSGYKK